jgi:hypothetical protein
MDRIHIINYLIKKNNAKKYLEIGISDGSNFENVKIDYKVGVDPDSSYQNIIIKNSDDFFKDNTEKFDVIFIDGLHHSDQVYRDIVNSLECLNQFGIIICHDMLPTNEQMQEIPYRGGIWTGDCWKAFVKLRQERENLEMFTIDVDMGVSVIRKGSQNKFYTVDTIQYSNFDYFKWDWMNIYSLIDFYKMMGEEDILKCLLNHYIEFPNSPEINFYLGVYYNSIGQTASAISYYLRAAERSSDDLLKYESLIKASICFESQGCRNNSVQGMLQHSVALMPKRPEGYFYLSRFYEKTHNWFNSYLMASIGEKVSCKNPSRLRENLDYPGFYGIIFEKAVSSWHSGLCSESRDIFKYLSVYEPLNSIYKNSVVANLKNLNYWRSEDSFFSFFKNKEQEIENSKNNMSLYSRENFENLKYKFPDSENIERNYSESFQDIFILTLMDGKTNGTYLEIGGAYPFYGNNTYLLESQFKWNGITLDIEAESSERYFRDRENISLCADAQEINYTHLLRSCNMPRNIDYLQIDCDPPHVTYEILNKIPFDKYKFAIITYEHDYYQDHTKSYKQKSRDFLFSKGYELVLSNIAPQKDFDFEDWYVHPDLVDRNIINKIKNISDEIKIAKNIFLINE